MLDWIGEGRYGGGGGGRYFAGGRPVENNLSGVFSQLAAELAVYTRVVLLDGEQGCGDGTMARLAPRTDSTTAVCFTMTPRSSHGTVLCCLAPFGSAPLGVAG